MFKHDALSIKESSRKMFISKADKEKYNKYPDSLINKNDTYSKTEFDKITDELNETYENFASIFATIKDSKPGVIQEIELFGNTTQDPNNLADIRSVGQPQEDGQFKMSLLSTGKNLNPFTEEGYLNDYGIETPDGNYKNIRSGFVFAKAGTTLFWKYLNSNGSVSIEQTWIVEYTREKVFKSKAEVSVNNKTFNEDTYVRLHRSNTEIVDIIISTSPITTHEPYQSNKNDILLPVQLEGIGDAKDRLFKREDGVWCIEKNVRKIEAKECKTLGGYNSPIYNPEGLACFKLDVMCDKLNTSSNTPMICKYFKNVTLGDMNIAKKPKMCSLYSDGNIQSRYIYICDEITVFGDNVEKMNKYLQTSDIYFLVPQIAEIIELPLETQIALNSFAGTTHVFSQDTEIEPTIKGKVSKSLKATIDSITNETDILSKRIDKVKRMEEGSKLQYKTDKGYEVCENTHNGIVEDMRIEGKTLVNLFGNHKSQGTIEYQYQSLANSVIDLKLGVEYTLILKSDVAIDIKQAQKIHHQYNTLNVEKILKFKADAGKLSLIVIPSSGTYSISILLLEGDYTDKALSYFEGLKSVGDGVDEIEVLSVDNKNNFKALKKTIFEGGDAREVIGISKIYCDGNILNHTDKMIRCLVGKNNTYNRDIDILPNTSVNYNLSDSEYIYAINRYAVHGWDISNLGSVYNCVTINAQSDKKPILFINKEDKLEKPVLRALPNGVKDTIEKHSDGKYYYHKRCNEVVLNGSENWSMMEAYANDTTICVNTNIPDKYFEGKTYSYTNIIADRFMTEVNTWKPETVKECISGNNSSNTVFVRLLKSKLSSPDIAGATKWFQANNVTIVYEITKEEVYECTNLDLSSYDNETMISFNGGPIAPNMSFTISGYIANTINALKKRISNLENDIMRRTIFQNRLLLDSKYTSDSTDLKVDISKLGVGVYNVADETDMELYNLIGKNIVVGKDNYDRLKMEEIIDFYAMTGKLSFEKADELFLRIELQHTEIVEEVPPVEEEHPAVTLPEEV